MYWRRALNPNFKEHGVACVLHLQLAVHRLSLSVRPLVRDACFFSFFFWGGEGVLLAVRIHELFWLSRAAVPPRQQLTGSNTDLR